LRRRGCSPKPSFVGNADRRLGPDADCGAWGLSAVDVTTPALRAMVEGFSQYCVMPPYDGINATLISPSQDFSWRLDERGDGVIAYDRRCRFKPMSPSRHPKVHVDWTTRNSRRRESFCSLPLTPVCHTRSSRVVLARRSERPRSPARTCSTLSRSAGPDTLRGEGLEECTKPHPRGCRYSFTGAGQKDVLTTPTSLAANAGATR
jgi:hypothetical protein